jgi:hypothetical protein
MGVMFLGTLLTLLTLILRTAFFWFTKQRVVVIYYLRFGTTYLSHLQRPLMVGPIGCPETSVRNYHYTLLSKPEEGSSNLLRGGSLKLQIILICLPMITASLQLQMATSVIITSILIDSNKK